MGAEGFAIKGYSPYFSFTLSHITNRKQFWSRNLISKISTFLRSKCSITCAIFTPHRNPLALDDQFKRQHDLLMPFSCPLYVTVGRNGHSNPERQFEVPGPGLVRCIYPQRLSLNMPIKFLFHGCFSWLFSLFQHTNIRKISILLFLDIVFELLFY